MRFEEGCVFVFLGVTCMALAFSVSLRVVVWLHDGCCGGIDGLASIFSSGIADFISPAVLLILPQIVGGVVVASAAVYCPGCPDFLNALPEFDFINLSSSWVP